MNLFETLGKSLKPQQQITKTQIERVQYREEIIDLLKSEECVPESIARSMVREYANDLEWSRLFSKSPKICAKRIFTKYATGEKPIRLGIDEC